MTVVNANPSDSSGTPYFISVAGTYKIKEGAGQVLRIIFGSSSDQSIDILDGDVAKVCISCKDTVGNFEINAAFENGLTVVTGFDFNVTIIYT